MAQQPTSLVRYARLVGATCLLTLVLVPSMSTAVTWDSNTQFSGVQGQSDWFYQYGTAALRDDDLGYDSSIATWVHPTIPYLWIWRSGAHPGPTFAAARNWQSPLKGSATITVNLSDANPGGGNGVVVSIYRNTLPGCITCSSERPTSSVPARWCGGWSSSELTRALSPPPPRRDATPAPAPPPRETRAPGSPPPDRPS